MALSKKLIAGGLAALALLATAGAAFAAPAYATGNVNVRSGPGTNYGQVDVLTRGQQVDVQYCQGSWCYVEKRGPDGWVSSGYLSRSSYGGGYDDDWDRPPHWNPAPPPPPPIYNPRPPRPPVWNDPRPQPYPIYPSYPTYPSYPGNGNSGSVCFSGPNGYFCAGN